MTPEEILELTDTLAREAGVGTGEPGGEGWEASAILGILASLQQHCRHLPVSALQRLSTLTGRPLGELWGTATFYDLFRRRPAGEHRIQVCTGTACFIKGAGEIYGEFRKVLGLAEGEDTDARQLFTVEKVSCLGCCMLAPVVQIGSTVYGNLTSRGLEELLSDYLSREAAPGPAEPENQYPDGATDSLKTGELPRKLRICECSSCRAAGADVVRRTFESEILALGLPLKVESVSCTGLSFQAPLVELEDRSVHRYLNVKPDQVREILLKFFRIKGLGPRIKAGLEQAAGALLRPSRRAPERAPVEEDTSRRISTEHAGLLPPLDLKAYRASGGLAALEAVQSMNPEEVLRVLEESGLRGRGGAGFPSARKWRLVKDQPSTRKVLVCNGDEGDPGAFMDRMLLESFPFRVLEGMMIAVRVLGITEAYLFIRTEYPVAVERVAKALEIWRDSGLHGGVPFRIVQGAGAFVCGEETALLEAMEGRRGIPRPRPPYPGEKGFLGLPTLVNNVETFSLIPWILREGSDAFHLHGTAGSRGTKTFALAGKIRRSGLIEVPLGTSLRQVVEGYGGGLPEGSILKAVQLGGPSGGCLPAGEMDVPVDFDSLQARGAIMGSGGLIVMDQHDCMVDIARYFMEFSLRESCGRCAPCRSGTARMADLLEGLCKGRGRPGDLEELEELGNHLRRHSACGLGRNAPNPVLSTLRHFREEYQAHLEGRCPALRCRDLVKWTIGNQCIGCTKCRQVCPVQAVAGNPYQRHRIDSALCTRCGLCAQACHTGAAHGE